MPALSLVECPAPYGLAAAQPAPLLPAEVAWSRTLEFAPAATAAADDARIYVPLTNGQIVALSRGSGDLIWTADLTTRWPLVVLDESLLALSDGSLVELDRASGAVRRRHALPASATGPLTREGELLLIPLEPALLIAWHTQDGREIWRQSFDAPVTVAPAVNGSWGLVIAAAGNRVSGLALSDGARRWTTELAGTLMRPIIARDRVILGSTSDDVYALDARGRWKWTWPGRADVVGVTADAEQVYVASQDHIVTALKPDKGDHQWHRIVKTRLMFAPQLVASTLLIGGLEPALTALSTRGGDGGKYELPELAFLIAAPLVLDGAEPDGVTMVLFTGHREVLGLRRQPPKEEPQKNNDEPQKKAADTDATK